MVTYPNDWTHFCINDFLKIKRGASPRPIESYLTKNADGLNWIKIGDAPKSGKYIVSTKEKITESGAAQSVRVYPGDFLLSNSMSFGRPYILHLEGCIHDGWLRLFDYQEKADDDYLYYLLSSDSIQNQYKSFAAGSGVQNLNKEVVKKVEVCLPSLPEQESIAEILSCMDDHIANLTELIEKKKAIRDGALEDLVSGRTRLDGFSEEWDKTTIGGILTILHGRNQKDVESFDGKYPILGTGGVIGKATEYLCDWECVLIGRKGTIDKPMYMNTPFWTIDTLYYSRPKVNQCVKYQYYLFCTIDWYAYTESSGRPSLAKKVIEGIEVKIPKFEEQKAIVEVLSSLDAEIEFLEEEKDKMLQIKAGAMDDLLTGRIRLTRQGG
jgi:type I restriction enzyme S subunit